MPVVLQHQAVVLRVAARLAEEIGYRHTPKAVVCFTSYCFYVRAESEISSIGLSLVVDEKSGTHSTEDEIIMNISARLKKRGALIFFAQKIHSVIRLIWMKET